MTSYPRQEMKLTGLPDMIPPEVTRGVVDYFRIHFTYSNAFAAWKQMGSPQSLSASEYYQLQKEGQLQLRNAPESVPIQNCSRYLALLVTAAIDVAG